MPNMLDYLAWRGDLPAEADGMNENDWLILSQIAYIGFDGIVPGLEAGGSVPLRQAAEALLSKDPDGKLIHQTGYMWENNKKLLRALAESRRFGDLPLWGYVSSTSLVDEKQFAAICMSPAGGTHIAFRGTDDTLIGWKEDLNMAYDAPVPAQLESVRYLQAVATRTEGPLTVSGHSKGGNLAIYAAACAEAPAQRRIEKVISHDGPGQDVKTVRSEGYLRVRDRIVAYTPQFSIVGMLLEHENDFTVVQSDAKTVLQHDAFSWQMQGPAMLRAEGPSGVSTGFTRVLHDWLSTLDVPERKLFVDAVYEIAQSTYGETIPDLEPKWTAGAHSAFATIRGLEPGTRSMFYKSLGDLFATALKTLRLPWRKDEAVER